MLPTPGSPSPGTTDATDRRLSAAASGPPARRSGRGRRLTRHIRPTKNVSRDLPRLFGQTRRKRGSKRTEREKSRNYQGKSAGAARPRAAVLIRPAAAAQLAQAGQIELDGGESALATLAGLLDEFDPNFNIVTP
jgi:hypothetical protein